MVVECRIQGQKKVMCWAGIINGEMIFHWFSDWESLNGASYLEMLEDVVWHRFRTVATRRSYWFQQDGATPHTTLRTRALLQEKFRVISRLTTHIWPVKSPDLSPLDFYFWGVAMQELPPSFIFIKTVSK